MLGCPVLVLNTCGNKNRKTVEGNRIAVAARIRRGRKSDRELSNQDTCPM